MANYHIGLDFGTSQTKVCILNKDSDIREFLKFENDKYFLPSLIVKKSDNTFQYGNELEKGIKYRYFKMAAAEDEDLIQITNEDLKGDLVDGTIDSFRKYSTNFDIKPEILVILYLTYILLYIKKKKELQSQQNVGGLLGRLLGNKSKTENNYSINLGIPTEWNNPNHLKRKIKFQSLLIASVELSRQFEDLSTFLKTREYELLENIALINNNHLKQLNSISEAEKSTLLNNLLKKNNLSVFPESAAGVNYLLNTKRLSDGAYATLDIGAGTSDIAIFLVNNNKLTAYYCSESTEIASNDFYREYAKLLSKNDSVNFEDIKNAEKLISEGIELNIEYYKNALQKVRGSLNNKGITFAIRKTFFRKYLEKTYEINKLKAIESINILNECPIIVFGGGANFRGFTSGKFCFYIGSNALGNHDKNFIAKPITDYVQQVEIKDDKENIQTNINLLILALGLTYGFDNNDTFPFVNVKLIPTMSTNNSDRYFYYDLQDAVFK